MAGVMRTSPKNSDYIKHSILSGGKSARRYQLPRQQPADAKANSIKRGSHNQKLVPTESDEDCNSFIDEMDFDEDHPVIDP